MYEKDIIQAVKDTWTYKRIITLWATCFIQGFEDVNVTPLLKVCFSAIPTVPTLATPSQNDIYAFSIVEND